MPVTRLIKHQHLDISQCLHGLGSLAKGYYSDMNEFKSKLNAITQSLVSFGRMHIAVEEAILYPIAAEEIANSEVWERYWVFFDQLKQSA
jgi:hemerythrin-like domain-containing protein